MQANLKVGVSASCNPAESSGSMPHRCRCPRTRVASIRSGVTSAETKAGRSSPSRNASAMVLASVSSSSHWYSVTSSKAVAMASDVKVSSPRAPAAALASLSASAPVTIRQPSVSLAVISAGSMARDSRRVRASRSPAPDHGQRLTASGPQPQAFSNSVKPCCGWVTSPAISPHASALRSSSSPGRMTTPCGRSSTAESKSRVEGIEPVDPAAKTGPVGGASRHCRIWFSTARRRRAAAEIRPASASTPGQTS